MVCHEAGMGSSATAGLAFSMKRLVREYGSALESTHGSLSISGTVSPADVYAAFVRPACYKLEILKTLIQNRTDFNLVLPHLRTIVFLKVEVIPVILVRAKYHRSVYVYCILYFIPLNNFNFLMYLQLRLELRGRGQRKN